MNNRVLLLLLAVHAATAFHVGGRFLGHLGAVTPILSSIELIGGSKWAMNIQFSVLDASNTSYSVYDAVQTFGGGGDLSFRFYAWKNNSGVLSFVPGWLEYATCLSDNSNSNQKPVFRSVAQVVNPLQGVAIGSQVFLVGFVADQFYDSFGCSGNFDGLPFNYGAPYYNESFYPSSVPSAPFVLAPSPLQPILVSVTPALCVLTTSSCPPAMVVTWSVSSTTNNGASDQSYGVYWSAAGITQTQRFGLGVRSATISANLTRGVTYVWWVDTSNGYVNTASLNQSVLVATRPDLPRNVTLAVVDPTTLQVSWSAPAGADGGSPVLETQVDCSLFSDFSLLTSQTLNGSQQTTAFVLLNGYEYFCRVIAVNAVGQSAVAIQTGFLGTAPDPVSNVSSVLLTPSSLRLSWSPGNNNGSPVLFYSVTNLNTQDMQTTANPTCVFENLTAGVEYSFAVIAINSIGASVQEMYNATQLGAPRISGVLANGSVYTKIEENSTLGGTLVSLEGNGFDRFGAPSVFVSAYLAPVLWFNASALEIQIPAGTGANLSLRVLSGSAWSAPFGAISYPSPVLFSVHRPNEAPQSPALAARTSLSEPLVLEGLNFGTDASVISVTYGNGLYTCSIQNAVNDSLLVCLTERANPLSLRNLTFQMTVNGQTAVLETEAYDYPVSPIIQSISGCSLEGCPTTGGVTVTIEGQYLTEPLTVLVQGALCGNVSFLDPPASRASCWLPPGTGYNQPVVAIQETFFSDPQQNALNYSAPSVFSVFAPDGLSLNRTGRSDNLTIAGSNFGAFGARALIGGVACFLTQHDAQTPHSKLYCTPDVGAGQNLVVSVEQYHGELSASNDSVTVSYEVCPAGSFFLGVECPLCAEGTANALPNQAFCPACLVGFFTNTTGETYCEACPAGSVGMTSNQSLCVACGPGTFTDQEAQSTCLPCPAGAAKNDTSLFVCSPCALGTYQTEPGAFGCATCEPGFYSGNSTGAQVCLPCALGRYSNVSGASSCLVCPQDEIALDNATGCATCPSGQVSTDGIRCHGCAAGFGFVFENSACQACVPGFFQDQEGQDACVACAAGRSTALNSSTQCAFCSTGTHQNKTAQTSCMLCSPGYFNNQTTESVECAACPAGQYVDYEGATRCFDCTKGFFSAPAAPACSECAAGTVSSGAGATECTACPAGSEAFSTVCVTCTAGLFSVDGVACTSCAENHFQDEQGASSCKLCSAGLFSKENETAACSFCPLGTAGLGCTQCVSGSVATTLGSTTCGLCPSGSVPNKDQTGCIDVYEQSSAVKNGFVALNAAAGALVLLVAVLWTTNRKDRVVVFSSPVFMYLAMLATLLLFAADVLWILDPTNAVCHSKHVFLNLGAGLFLMSIVLKTWRLFKIYHRTEKDNALKVVRITDFQLIKALIVAVLYDLIVLLLWWGLAPFSVDATTKQCLSPHSVEIPLSVVLWWWKLAVGGFLIYLTYQVKDIDERFNEAMWLDMAMYNFLVTFLFFVVLSFGLSWRPSQWLVFFAVLIFYLTLSSFGLVFFPKIYRMHVVKHEYRDLYGDDVADEISQAEKVFAGATAPEAPGDAKQTESIEKLKTKKAQKTRELESALKLTKSAKQNMKAHVAKVGRLSGDVLALDQELLYRQKHTVYVQNQQIQQEEITLSPLE
jgi:hypothetical protein